MKANQRAIFILQRSSAFAAIAALFCLAVFLQDPSEPKNALFLGYCAPRLAVAVLIGCAALFIIALSSSLWIQEGRPGSLGAWAVSQLSKLLAHRRNLRTLSIGTLFGIFLVLSVLLWRQGSPPFYHMYLERLEPLISWFLIFFVLLFTVVWLLASDKKMNASEVSTLFQDALCASSLYFIFVYLVAVSGRIHYPFELEWVEGGMLSVVERVRMGLPAYQAPTLDYAPFIYPPLYFQFADSLSPLVGSSFLSLRLLSFLASVCAAGLLYLIAYRETGQRSLGLLSVGLYAAGYAASGAWYDLARVDSLMLLLVLAAYYVLRFQPQRHRELLASLFIVLACFTKQQAFLFIPALALAAWHTRRSGLLFLGATALLLIAFFLSFDQQTGGWLSFYTWQIPALHGLLSAKLSGFWLQEGLAILLSVLGLLIFFAAFSQKLPVHGRYFTIYFLLAAVASAWSSSLSNGSFHNHLIPLMAALAVAIPTSLHWLASITSRRALNLGLAALLVVLVQFVSFHYNLLQVIPTPQDRQAGQELLDRIAEFEGEIFIPRHPYLAGLAGKTETAHLAAFGEVLGFYAGPVLPEGEALWQEIDQAIRTQRFSLILLDTQGWMLRTFPAISEYYHLSEMNFYSDSLVFRPVSGLPTRPQFFYLPNNTH